MKKYKKHLISAAAAGAILLSGTGYAHADEEVLNPEIQILSTLSDEESNAEQAKATSTSGTSVPANDVEKLWIDTDEYKEETRVNDDGETGGAYTEHDSDGKDADGNAVDNSGWKYSKADGLVMENSGSAENGIDIAFIGDNLDIHTLGVNYIQSIKSSGSVYFDGTGLVMIDSFQASDMKMDKGSCAAIFLKDENNNKLYSLCNPDSAPGILSDNYVLPAGYSFVLTDGTGMKIIAEATITPDPDEIENDAFATGEALSGTLTIPDGSALTVQTGASLEVEYAIDYCDVVDYYNSYYPERNRYIVIRSVDAAGNLIVDGELNIETGGTVKANGTITVSETGKLTGSGYVSGGESINNYNSKGTVYYNTTQTDSSLNLGGNITAILDKTGTVGNVSIYGKNTLNVTSTCPDKALIISKLSVAQGASLEIYGNTSLFPVTIKEEYTSQSGKYDFPDDAVVTVPGTTGNNLYYSNVLFTTTSEPRLFYFAKKAECPKKILSDPNFTVIECFREIAIDRTWEYYDEETKNYKDSIPEQINYNSLQEMNLKFPYQKNLEINEFVIIYLNNGVLSYALINENSPYSFSKSDVKGIFAFSTERRANSIAPTDSNTVNTTSTGSGKLGSGASVSRPFTGCPITLVTPSQSGGGGNSGGSETSSNNSGSSETSSNNSGSSESNGSTEESNGNGSENNSTNGVPGETDTRADESQNYTSNTENQGHGFALVEALTINEDSFEIRLDNARVNSIIQQGYSGLSINSGIGTISIPVSVLSQFRDASGIRVEISRLSETECQVMFYCGNSAVNMISSGMITITLSFSGDSKPIVYFISDGQKTEINCDFDAVKGLISFSTNHTGDFIIE